MNIGKIIKYPSVVVIALSLLFTFTSVQPIQAAPTQTTDPARQAEYVIMFDYLYQAPKLPKKTIKITPADIQTIKALVLADSSAETYAEARVNMSSQSMQMFDHMPLFVSDMNSELDPAQYQLKKIDKPKLYKGGQYASVKTKVKNLSTRRTETTTLFFIKENGQWKVDYIQSLKKELSEYL